MPRFILALVLSGVSRIAEVMIGSSRFTSSLDFTHHFHCLQCVACSLASALLESESLILVLSLPSDL
jgi:hypothetical protein